MVCNCVMCKNNKPFELPVEIIEAAINNELVVFCGAGISTENKNVLPYSFYTSIQSELNLSDSSISFSNLMQQYCCSRPNGRKKLLKNIHERLEYIDSFPELKRAATRFHRELAEMHMIRTIITTNWDCYFEEYCKAIPITIPEDFAFWDNNSRYVIKIHGSINNVGSIIATTDDYKKCYDSLQNGIIGATMKNILATKTVVFIGFSFGDEDFSQIIEYLRTEMGDIFPHIYIVTVDETLGERLNYKNSTCIVTDGTYFIHRLKEELCKKECIVNVNSKHFIEEALDVMQEFHAKSSKIDIKNNPSAIYNLFYQDGVIHSFERFISMYGTGEYNQPGRIPALARNYELLVSDALKEGSYCDEAYYEGYMNGLILIEACNNEPKAIYYFPYLYLPNAKQELTTYDVFLEELKRLSSKKDKYIKYAKSILGGKNFDDLVVHHPPY